MELGRLTTSSNKRIVIGSYYGATRATATQYATVPEIENERRGERKTLLQHGTVIITKTIRRMRSAYRTQYSVLVYAIPVTCLRSQDPAPRWARVSNRGARHRRVTLLENTAHATTVLPRCAARRRSPRRAGRRATPTSEALAHCTQGGVLQHIVRSHMVTRLEISIPHRTPIASGSAAPQQTVQRESPSVVPQPARGSAFLGSKQQHAAEARGVFGRFLRLRPPRASANERASPRTALHTFPTASSEPHHSQPHSQPRSRPWIGSPRHATHLHLRRQIVIDDVIPSYHAPNLPPTLLRGRAHTPPAHHHALAMWRWSRAARRSTGGGGLGRVLL